MSELDQDSGIKSQRSFFLPINIALSVFIIDQLTKLLIVKFVSSPIVVIPGFFNLIFITNKGAAWGKFKDYPLVLTLLAIAAIIFLVWKFKELSENNRLREVAIALLIGGIAGNLFDRLFRGAVIDFLDFHIGRFHWPAFNIADSAITIGVLIILASSFSYSPMEKKVYSN